MPVLDATSFNSEVEKIEHGIRRFLRDWAESHIEELRDRFSEGETVWVWHDSSYAVGRDLMTDYGCHVASNGLPIGTASMKRWREPQRAADALWNGYLAMKQSADPVGTRA